MHIYAYAYNIYRRVRPAHTVRSACAGALPCVQAPTCWATAPVSAPVAIWASPTIQRASRRPPPSASQQRSPPRRPAAPARRPAAPAQRPALRRAPRPALRPAPARGPARAAPLFAQHITVRRSRAFNLVRGALASPSRYASEVRPVPLLARLHRDTATVAQYCLDGAR